MAGIEIDPEAPGYQHFVVRPRPGGGFTRVSARHETMYGTVRSAWESKDGSFELLVTVPPNTRATVYLPATHLAAVTEGGQSLAVGGGVIAAREERDAVVVEVGSGEYAFRTAR